MTTFDVNIYINLLAKKDQIVANIIKEFEVAPEERKKATK
jgi:hypothetical protein